MTTGKAKPKIVRICIDGGFMLEQPLSLWNRLRDPIIGSIDMAALEEKLESMEEPSLAE